MNDKIKEYVRAWLSKAASDLKNARMILSAKDPSPPLDTVCFHCQQASEKYLKAYLIHHGRPYAVEIRYPDDFYMPTKQEAEESLAITIEIKDFIFARLDVDFSDGKNG